MKFRLFATFTLICWSGAMLFGQDLVGMWQGTLSPPGNPLRVVFKFNKTADGKFEGQAIAVDQNGQIAPLDSIAVEGRSVRLRIVPLNGIYQGTFTSDGNAINGSLTQGSNPPRPLNLVRPTPETAFAIPEPPPTPKPMDPAADPGIEVATIKPSPPDARGRGLGVQGQQLRAVNYSMLDVITFAYDLHPRQVSGGPAWMSTDRFEIVLKPDTPGQPNAQQVRRLMQKVLDRFQLKFHIEKREQSAYVITLLPNAKHKLTQSASTQNLPEMRFTRPGLLPAGNATMDQLAQALQRSVLDRPVINQTKIEGRYDFTLDWTPDEFQFAQVAQPPQIQDTGKPNIYQAFQEQLGLKLESTKAQADIFVIDKAEKPSEN